MIFITCPVQDLQTVLSYITYLALAQDSSTSQKYYFHMLQTGVQQKERSNYKANALQSKIYTAAPTSTGSLINSGGFTQIFLYIIIPGTSNIITGHHIIQDWLVKGKE